jgi:hypothetical protein
VERQRRNYRTQVVPVLSGPEGLTPAQAELGFQFVNHLHRPVTVLTRTGLRLIIPYRPRFSSPRPDKGTKKPGPLDNEPRFVIRAKVHAHHDVILDTTELSNDCGVKTSVEAQAYLDSVQMSTDKIVRKQTQDAWVEYIIPATDFDANGGVLFLQHIDLQVSILDQASTAPHPYSMLGQRNRDAYDFKEDMAPRGVFYGVYIRDKDNHFGERFININGHVYGVQVLTDESTERDGVYYVHCGRTNSSFVPTRVCTEYFSFEEADEKLGLYQTYREALALGDPQEKFKREYETRIQTLKNDELQLKEDRAAQERELDAIRDRQRREMMEYEHQLLRIQQLNKLIAAELERREQIYKREMMILKEITDGRSAERKEAGEIIKLLPTIITTVATYVAAYKKLKSL